MEVVQSERIGEREGGSGVGGRGGAGGVEGSVRGWGVRLDSFGA